MSLAEFFKTLHQEPVQYYAARLQIQVRIIHWHPEAGHTNCCWCSLMSRPALLSDGHPRWSSCTHVGAMLVMHTEKAKH